MVFNLLVYTFYNIKMTSEIQQYADDLKQFAKESEYFLVRC